MNHFEQLNKIAQSAIEEINDNLDIKNEIILYNEKDRDYDEDDPINELPTQLFIGKYGYGYWYHIIKLYKEGDKYYATGLDEDEKWEYYQFTLDELDVNVLAELADLLNNQS